MTLSGDVSERRPMLTEPLHYLDQTFSLLWLTSFFPYFSVYYTEPCSNIVIAVGRICASRNVGTSTVSLWSPSRYSALKFVSIVTETRIGLLSSVLLPFRLSPFSLCFTQASLSLLCIYSFNHSRCLIYIFICLSYHVKHWDSISPFFFQPLLKAYLLLLLFFFHYTQFSLVPNTYIFEDLFYLDLRIRTERKNLFEKYFLSKKCSIKNEVFEHPSVYKDSNFCYSYVNIASRSDPFINFSESHWLWTCLWRFSSIFRFIPVILSFCGLARVYFE